jgi:homoserine kinase
VAPVSARPRIATERIVVRAPATSANLGPGFDCLGLALDLWNEVEAEPSAQLVVRNTDGSPVPPPEKNLVLTGAGAVFERCGQALPAMALACTNRVPFSRGLGSSAAAIVSGALLANRWLGNALSVEELLETAIDVEGHPDNVTPCLLGGVRVAVRNPQGRAVVTSVPLARPLLACVFVPEVTLSTERARAALPHTVPFGDALFNVGRAALLVAALAGGDESALREATRDRLHQPYRSPLFPSGNKLMKAAVGAGALGACISGAGPSVLAFCRDEDHAMTIGEAMAKAAREERLEGRALRLPITPLGAHVVTTD